jgi:ATP-binding protein involved in chromosome partitioning
VTNKSCPNTDKENTKVNEEAKIVNNLAHIKHKIVIMSGKGGVGKSTIAVNLAVTFSLQGFDVGLLDCDIHGPSIPKMLSLEDEKLLIQKNVIGPVIVSPHLKVVSMGFLITDKDTPVIWRGPLKMGVIRQFLGEVSWGKLDYLIIDLPPGTGDEPLSIAQLLPNSDGAIIVTTPQDVALLSVRKSINFAKSLKMSVIGIIENMSGFVCPNCNTTIDIFGKGGGEKIANDFNIPLLGKIPIDAKIAETGDKGKPIVSEYKNSESTKIFENIVDKIKQFIVKKNGEII